MELIVVSAVLLAFWSLNQGYPSDISRYSVTHSLPLQKASCYRLDLPTRSYQKVHWPHNCSLAVTTGWLMPPHCCSHLIDCYSPFFAPLVHLQPISSPLDCFLFKSFRCSASISSAHQLCKQPALYIETTILYSEEYLLLTTIQDQQISKVIRVQDVGWLTINVE